MRHTGNLCDRGTLVVGASCYLPQWMARGHTKYWRCRILAVEDKGTYLSVAATVDAHVSLSDDNALVFTTETCFPGSSSTLWPDTTTTRQQVHELLVCQRELARARSEAAAWQMTHEKTVEHLARVGKVQAP